MSDLTVLLLILLTEMVNKHNYAFMQIKDEACYKRDDFSPAFPCVHYYEWWWSGGAVFSWNKKCSPLSQKTQTSLLCSKRRRRFIVSVLVQSFDYSSRAPDCKMISVATSNSSCPISNCQFSV